MASARWNSLNWTHPKTMKRQKIKDLTDNELLDKLKIYETKLYRNKTEFHKPVAYRELLKEATLRGLRNFETKK